MGRSFVEQRNGNTTRLLLFLEDEESILSLQGLEAYVEYSLENGQTLQSPVSTGINHRFVLGGIPESHAIEAVIKTPEGDSGVLRIETGLLNYQPITSTSFSENIDGFLLTTIRGDAPGIAIWNGDGELVWSLSQPISSGVTLQSHYLYGQLFRNFLDIQHIQEIGQIEVMDIEGYVEGRIDLPLHHHSFTPIGPSQLCFNLITVEPRYG